MTIIHSLACPSAIPAEALELLKHLISREETTERDLEDWLRSYPSVLGSYPDGLFPKTKFLLPGEPPQYWEPDILYRKVGESLFDVVELKKAQIPLIVGGREISLTRWKPSQPPRFSSYITSAISQLEIYIFYAQDHREFLEKVHEIDLFLPRGLLIAGIEAELTSARDLRLLRHQLPSNIDFITWTGILRIAEQYVAHRVLIHVPCVPARAELDFDVARLVTSEFLPWTGFSYQMPSSLEIFHQYRRKAEAEFAEEGRVLNDDHDEDRKILMRSQERLFGQAYYRAGKYCYNKRELDAAIGSIGSNVGITPRSFGTPNNLLKEGFESAQAFVGAGASEDSIEGLRTRIDSILSTRRDSVREPDWYYRRLMTLGFLQRNLLNADVAKILKAAGWVNDQDE